MKIIVGRAHAVPNESEKIDTKTVQLHVHFTYTNKFSRNICH